MSGWGVIGTGRVADQMAAGIGRADGAHLVGVVSRNHERGATFAVAHGAQSVYGSLEKMLVDPALDVVYVASPNSLHVEQVALALAADMHVLCEKPLANDASSCQRLIELAVRRDRLLGVALQYRQHPAHRAIRDTLAKGTLGESVVADAAVHVPDLPVPDWYGDHDSAGGGVVPMAGVHRLDLLRFVLGAEVTAVDAVVRTRVTQRVYEDTVAAVLEFDNGCLATVRFVMNVLGPGDGVYVAGTRGWANAVRTTSQWWSDDGGDLTLRVGDEIVSTVYPRQDLYRLQVENFEAAMAGDGEFAATGIDGLRAAEITSAIFESARTQRRVTVTPITWPAKPTDV